MGFVVDVYLWIGDRFKTTANPYCSVALKKRKKKSDDLKSHKIHLNIFFLYDALADIDSNVQAFEEKITGPR